MSEGGTEREGDIESKEGSRIRAVSTELKMGLKLTSCGDHDLSGISHLTD